MMVALFSSYCFTRITDCYDLIEYEYVRQSGRDCHSTSFFINMNVKKIESYLQRDDWDVLAFCKVKGNQRRFFNYYFFFIYFFLYELRCFLLFEHLSKSKLGFLHCKDHMLC